jgi:hypothetical protein
MRPETYFVKDGKITIYKNPGARLKYGIDLAEWLAEAGTALLGVTAGDVVGVTLDGQPFIDGTWICAWVTGLDQADGADNLVTFDFTCTDGKSEDSRTIHFLKRPG